MTGSKGPEQNRLDEYFQAVDTTCAERGLTAERIDSPNQGYLGIRLHGVTRKWEIFVECDKTTLTALPHLNLGAPRGLLAHVGYSGSICVNDGQGLSVDPERRAEIIAHTVLAGYDLLEESAADANGGFIEFNNELEGYWSGLPGVCKGRAAFEVDGKDRLLTARVDRKAKPPKWWFTEYGQPPPPEFRVDKAVTQRTLYVHLNKPPLPPVHPQVLEANFIEAVREALSPAQLELWARLVGPSKNSPKRAVLLVSAPRAAGGLTLLGAEFGAKDGKVDAKATVIPLTARRHSSFYMRERGGALPSYLDKHVVVLGCGAVGSVVADALASSGIGKLSLVDNDDFTEDNVFRHVLGPFWIDHKKVRGLEIELELRYPGIKVQGIPTTAQDWLEGSNLAGVDGIVMAIGIPSLERLFARIFRARDSRLPVVFTWLEPLDLGGHSVLTWTKGEGCLDCLYRDDEGMAVLYPRTSFLEPNQPVSMNLTGCSSVFVPYGALQSRRTGLLAAEHLLAALGGMAENSYRYWVGAGRVAEEQGLRVMPWRDIARQLSEEEATRRVFGRPCKRCRQAK